MASGPDRSAAFRLATSAFSRAHRNRDVLGAVWEDLLALIRLVQAWAQRRYTGVSWRTIGTIVAALVYFINPLDAVPDILPLIGFADDASVIALAIASLRSDIHRFVSWEAARKVREHQATAKRMKK